MPAYEILNLRFSAIAGAAVARRRFVKAGANDTAVQAGNGEAAIGVSINAPAQYEILEIVDGIALVEAGAAIEANAIVQSDADGKAVTRTTGVALGTALTSAAAEGELISIKTPGCAAASDFAPADAVADLVAGSELGAKATLNTGTVADNNALTFTAVKLGTYGNDITVALVDPGESDKELAVAVAGKDITITLATGSTGAITSTGDTVAAAVANKPEAAALVTVANTSTSTGAGAVVAETAAALAGGVDSEGQLSLAKLNELLASLRAAGLLAV